MNSYSTADRSGNNSDAFRLASGSAGLDPLSLAVIHRGAARLTQLGIRTVAEALVELARGPAGSAAVLELLGRYELLTPAQIAAAGADKPLRVAL